MTVSTHTQAVNGTSFSSASITFTGVPVVDETIIIVDGAGLSKTYTAKGAETAASLQFNQASTAAAAATSLKACIEHANGHNGSITVTNTPAGTITLTLTTAGQVGTKAGDIPALITDGLANATATAFSGGNLGAETKNSGVILNAGTPDANQAHMNSPSTAKAIIDMLGQTSSGSTVVASTGSSNHAGVEAATGASSNEFAYNPSSKTRSITDTGFVIKQGVANKIAGTSLNPILSGSYKESLATGSIHVPNGIHKYRQSGTWATQLFDAYGGNLLQSDGTAKAGITNYGATVSLDTDNAATPTRAIPGEMTLLFNFVTFTTNNLDYSAITG